MLLVRFVILLTICISLIIICYRDISVTKSPNIGCFRSEATRTPAGIEPAGDDWLRIQTSMSCANFWYSPPLKFVPWDVKQTNKVTVFDIGQGTSFLCGRILQNSARLYEIVSESISIHPGRNSKIVAPAFGKATIYDFEARSWLVQAGIEPAGAT